MKAAESEPVESIGPLPQAVKGAGEYAERTRLETLSMMRTLGLWEAMASIHDEIVTLTGHKATMHWPTAFPLRPLDPREWRFAFKRDAYKNISVIFHWDPVEFERTCSQLSAFKIQDPAGNILAKEDFTPMVIQKIRAPLEHLTEVHNLYIAERNKTQPR